MGLQRLRCNCLGSLKEALAGGDQVVLVIVETGESPHFGLDVSVAAGVGSVGCAKVALQTDTLQMQYYSS
jgi:hypothetical protein